VDQFVTRKLRDVGNTAPSLSVAAFNSAINLAVPNVETHAAQQVSVLPGLSGYLPFAFAFLLISKQWQSPKASDKLRPLSDKPESRKR